MRALTASWASSVVNLWRLLRSRVKPIKIDVTCDATRGPDADESANDCPIGALYLFQPVLDDPGGYVAGAGDDNRIRLGAAARARRTRNRTGWWCWPFGLLDECSCRPRARSTSRSGIRTPPSILEAPHPRGRAGGQVLACTSAWSAGGRVPWNVQALQLSPRSLLCQICPSASPAKSRPSAATSA